MLLAAAPQMQGDPKAHTDGAQKRLPGSTNNSWGTALGGPEGVQRPLQRTCCFPCLYLLLECSPQTNTDGLFLSDR